eukprot:TRINITY_DN716_c0_g1_i1.p1 TRINITY_DN716_c0_g1~~TRINITY_DN716_c0_g1_i1.p1  ORF type:complete len:417 (-),score=71.99 TRINITY_DN716_c0_g1_i1:200-1450(-)
MGGSASQPTPSSSSVAPSLAVSNELECTWTQIEQKGEVPTPREGHCCVAIQNTDKLFIFGGGCNGPRGPVQNNDVYIFQANNLTWTKRVTSGDVPNPRTGATAQYINGYVYIVGGFSTVGGWSSDVYRYHVEQNSWELVLAQGVPPSPRDKLASCFANNKIYVFGGFGPHMEYVSGLAGSKRITVGEDSDEEEVSDDDESGHGDGVSFSWCNDTVALDIETNTWSGVKIVGPAPSPKAACGLGFVPDPSRLLTFGGRDPQNRVKDLWAFNLETNKWKKIDSETSGAAPSARSFHSFTMLPHNKAIVFGGIDRSNKHLNDLHVLEKTTTGGFCWLQPNQVQGEKPHPCGFHTAVVLGDKLWIWGGSSGYDSSTMEPTVFHNDMYTLDIASIINQPPITPPILPLSDDLNGRKSSFTS